ncbi:MAG: hypothetical protein LBJ64_03410 [Deltaproteobacteria bacterium]|jgi:type IV secretion system protein VirD4|nr:hypothetical protein [Deltaproteobacteria bacterium]
MTRGPGLSLWQFNIILGLSGKEHNRKLREERENKRPVVTDSSKPVTLWNVWVYCQKDIMRKADAEREKGAPRQS